MLIPVQAVGRPAGQICIDMTGIETAEYHKIRVFSQISFYNWRGEFIWELLSAPYRLSLHTPFMRKFVLQICWPGIVFPPPHLPRSPPGPACPLLWVVPPTHNSYKVNAGLTAGAELRRSPLSSHNISTKSRRGLIHELEMPGVTIAMVKTGIYQGVGSLLSHRLFTNSSAPLMGDTAPGHWPVGE